MSEEGAADVLVAATEESRDINGISQKDRGITNNLNFLNIDSSLQSPTSNVKKLEKCKIKTPASKLFKNSIRTPRKDGSPRPMRSSSAHGSGLRRARDSPQGSPTIEQSIALNLKAEIVHKTLDSRESTNGMDAVKHMDPHYFDRGFSSNASSRLSRGLIAYPLVYVSPAGTISTILSADLVIEMSVDRSIRIVHHKHFVVTISNFSGSTSAILHGKSKIIHTKDSIFSKFTSSINKIAVLGREGVLFTMSHLFEAYLMNIKGVSSIPISQLSFPSSHKNDYTLKMFYSEAQTGNQFMMLCNEIVDQAMYDRKPDGSVIMHLNGFHLKYQPSGCLTIESRPRFFSFDPTNESIHLRTSHIDVAIQSEDKASVKSGVKRVHVSRSGMVVSDGNSVTSMNHYGQILSCASILPK
ncbi:unnamed protein product [Auanema sp. JU1783]|nr:unnamed protein product [Auanema sp. JU1783]